MLQLSLCIGNIVEITQPYQNKIQCNLIMTPSFIALIAPL